MEQPPSSPHLRVPLVPFPSETSSPNKRNQGACVTAAHEPLYFQLISEVEDYATRLSVGEELVNWGAALAGRSQRLLLVTADIESNGRFQQLGMPASEEESTSYQSDTEHEHDYMHRPSFRPFSFLNVFSRGHDVQSAGVNHVYTREERRRLNDVESIDYLPINSEIYRVWLARQPHGCVSIAVFICLHPQPCMMPHAKTKQPVAFCQILCSWPAAALLTADDCFMLLRATYCFWPCDSPCNNNMLQVGVGSLDHDGRHWICSWAHRLSAVYPYWNIWRHQVQYSQVQLAYLSLRPDTLAQHMQHVISRSCPY